MDEGNLSLQGSNAICEGGGISVLSADGRRADDYSASLQLRACGCEGVASGEPATCEGVRLRRKAARDCRVWGVVSEECRNLDCGAAGSELRVRHATVPDEQSHGGHI